MEWFDNIIEDVWYSISQYFSNSSDDNLLSPLYSFVEGLFHIITQILTRLWTFFFGEFTSVVYNILFDNYDNTVSTGRFAVDRIFSFQGNSSDVFTVDMIYFFFGCIVIIFFFKLIVHIVLRLIHMS